MNFKNKILITFIFSFFFQGLIFIFLLENNDRKLIDFESELRLNKINDIYETEIELSTNRISSLITLIADNNEIKNIFKIQDRDKLYSRCIQINKSLYEKQNITHFYFHKIDQTNFLRVHNRPKNGDYIDRYTLKQAVKTNKTSSGVELGPFGTLTLRVVSPLYIENELIGYFELGKEIDNIFSSISNFLDIDLHFIVDKKFLSKDKWEEGLNLLEREGSWDKYKDFIVLNEIDLHEAEKVVFKNYSINAQKSQINQINNVESDNSYNSWKDIPFYDAKGSKIGILFGFHDTTEEINEVLYLIKVIIIFTIITGFFIFILFYKILSNTEKFINQTILKLDKSSHFLDKIINSSPDWIFVKDKNFKYKLVNNAYADVIGKSKDEIIGKDDTEIGFSDELVFGDKNKNIVGFRNDDIKCFTGKKINNPNNPATDKNGLLRIYDTHKIPLTNNENEIESILGIAREVTDIKIIEKQLIIAKEEAIQSTKSKSDFLSNMSHEIRTPMNGIISMCEKLMKSDLDFNQLQYAEIINNSSSSLLSIINDILDFSKLRQVN